MCFTLITKSINIKVKQPSGWCTLVHPSIPQAFLALQYHMLWPLPKQLKQFLCSFTNSFLLTRSLFLKVGHSLLRCSPQQITQLPGVALVALRWVLLGSSLPLNSWCCSLRSTLFPNLWSINWRPNQSLIPTKVIGHWCQIGHLLVVRPELFMNKRLESFCRVWTGVWILS